MHPATRSPRTLATALLLLPLAAPAGTVAYYRFENGAAGQALAIAEDSSGNGRHLTPYENPAAAADVPSARVPLSGEANRLSVRFTGTEDIYATADDSLTRVAFADFTLEAWVKFESLDGWQTFIGRDDSGNPGEGQGPLALLYFSKSTHNNPGPDQTENAFRIELVTRDNQVLAINSSFQVVPQTWYHVAAVGNAAAGTLKLYVNGAEVGATSGFNGLLVPAGNTAWTLGRGQYKGAPMDRFNGLLDEVRFSDEALPPQRFLNAAPPPPPAPPAPPAPALKPAAPEPAPAPENAPAPEKTAKRRGFEK